MYGNGEFWYFIIVLVWCVGVVWLVCVGYMSLLGNWLLGFCIVSCCWFMKLCNVLILCNCRIVFWMVVLMSIVRLWLVVIWIVILLIGKLSMLMVWFLSGRCWNLLLGCCMSWMISFSFIFCCMVVLLKIVLMLSRLRLCILSRFCSNGG